MDETPCETEMECGHCGEGWIPARCDLALYHGHVVDTCPNCGDQTEYTGREQPLADPTAQ